MMEEFIMLKEKKVLKFEYMEEAIKALESEHKKYEHQHERELIKETLKTIIKKIERVDGANQGTIKNEEVWGYNTDDEFYIIEKYEKETVAGASMYDESLSVHVEMDTEEIELTLEIKYVDEVRNLIDTPYRAESIGILSLSYNFK